MSIKESYAGPTESGDDIGEISQCELLVEDGLTPRVVALWKIFEGPTSLHNVALPLMW